MSYNCLVDAKSWKRLYGQAYKAAVGVEPSLSEEEREDIALSVIERLLRSPKFSEAKYKRAFIMTVTRNLIIDGKRRRFNLVPLEDNSWTDEKLQEIAEIEREFWELLIYLKRKLPVGCFYALMASTVDGISVGDLAERYGLPKRTIERRIAYAKRVARQWRLENGGSVA